MSTRGVRLVVVLVVALAGLGGWWWWRGRVPFGPEALAARVAVSFVDQASAELREVVGDAAVITVTSLAASPVVFQTLLPSVTDVMVAVIAVGTDGRVYWAERLTQ